MTKQQQAKRFKNNNKFVKPKWVTKPEPKAPKENNFPENNKSKTAAEKDSQKKEVNVPKENIIGKGGMSSSIFELILTFGFGLLVGAIAYFLNRKRPSSKDDILPRADNLAFGFGLLVGAIAYFLIRKRPSSKDDILPREQTAAEKDSQKKEVNVPKENIIGKVNEQPVDQNKNAKPKLTGAEVSSTNPPNESSELIQKFNEMKMEIDKLKNSQKENLNPNESSELIQKFNEMKMEIDKLKNSQKENLNPNSQVLEEVESLKVKLKSSLANEEKLLEDLKKKDQAVTDLKSKLTKNMFANQSVKCEKASLENQVRTLQEQNSLLTESRLTKNIVANQSVNPKKTSLKNQPRTLKNAARQSSSNY